MKEVIKELRVKIDGLSQLVKVLGSVNISEGKPVYIRPVEIDNCHTSLILAKAWLGKVLGELGESTPYANDGNRKTVADIEPTADKAVEEPTSINYEFTYAKNRWSTWNHIEKVDWLRQEIDKVIPSYYELDDAIEKYNPNQVTCSSLLWNAYTHLCEARFWLGFELQRIKERNAN